MWCRRCRGSEQKVQRLRERERERERHEEQRDVGIAPQKRRYVTVNQWRVSYVKAE